MKVFNRFGDGKLWLAAMYHREYMIATACKWIGRFWINCFRAREPATANYHHDCGTIRFCRWLENIHGQGEAVFSAINNIGLSVFLSKARRCCKQYKNKRNYNGFNSINQHGDKSSNKGKPKDCIPRIISEMNVKCEGFKNGLTKITVLKVGLEPTYPYGRHPLKMVCLPIPPLQRS